MCVRVMEEGGGGGWLPVGGLGLRTRISAFTVVAPVGRVLGCGKSRCSVGQAGSEELGPDGSHSGSSFGVCTVLSDNCSANIFGGFAQIV